MDFIAIQAGDGTCQDRFSGLDIIDAYVAQSVLGIVVNALAIAQSNEDGRACALHLDTADGDAVDPPTVNHLQCYAGDHALTKTHRVVVNYRVCEEIYLQIHLQKRCPI